MVEAAKRLRREFSIISKDPPPNILARPDMANILEWHYVIFGPKGTPYEGGTYHGKIKFPPEYPHKPPSIMMLTPSGRFQIKSRLCLSMSDFHPETWNPMWSVSTILTGLLSFMLEDQQTHGSVITSEQDKRKFAKNSLAWNSKNSTFKKHFPELLPESVQQVPKEEEEGEGEGEKEGGGEQRRPTTQSTVSATSEVVRETKTLEKDPKGLPEQERVNLPSFVPSNAIMVVMMAVVFLALLNYSL